MKTLAVWSYLLNSFWLIVPALVWNILFASRLPKAFSAEMFSKGVPRAVAVPENVLRALVFVVPCFMPLSVTSSRQRIGLVVYAAGMLAYFAAWILLMVCPQSRWSTGWAGFVAPAYTPLVWLLGIGLISESLYFAVPYQWWYFAVGAAAFVFFHVWHTGLVYSSH